MSTKRDMVARERKAKLQPVFHGKLKQGQQKGLVKEREREGTLQEQTWDNLPIWKNGPSVLLKGKSVPLAFLPAPGLFPESCCFPTEAALFFLCYYLKRCACRDTGHQALFNFLFDSSVQTNVFEQLWALDLYV